MLAARFHKLSIVCAFLSTLNGSALVGQWRVAVEVGAARYWGASRDTGGEHTSFIPYRPTTFGVGLERQSGRYAIGLKVHYAQASLALDGPQVVVANEGVFKVVSISPEAVIRLANMGTGNQLRLHAGPLLEIWDLIDLESRTRAGAQAAVSLDIPLGTRFCGTVNASAAVTPSPYNKGELDAGGGAPTYELRAMWRRSFGLGLRYQL